VWTGKQAALTVLNWILRDRAESHVPVQQPDVVGNLSHRQRHRTLDSCRWSPQRPKDAARKKRPITPFIESALRRFFVNVPETLTLTTATKSAHNVGLAVEAMECIHKPLQHMSGQDVAYITGYNAQLLLLKSVMQSAIQQTIDAKDAHLAEQLPNVTLSTIDSFMRNDRQHVIVELGKQVGFIFERPRLLVTYTRARMSAEFIGDSKKISKCAPRDAIAADSKHKVQASNKHASFLGRAEHYRRSRILLRVVQDQRSRNHISNILIHFAVSNCYFTTTYA
jgi:hypothetical protein